MARLFLLLQASLRPVEGILIRMISCLTAASTTWRSTPLAGFLLTHMGHFSSPFQELARTATLGRSTSTEKVVITGRIHPEGTATLRPFHLVTTEFVSGSGTTGEFSLQLVGPGGRTLLTYRFDAQHTGGVSSLAFSEFVLWKPGTQAIVLRSKKGVLAERRVSQHKPWVRLTSPRGGETWGPKATITWEAGDEDHAPLTFTVLYNNGLDQNWLPIANSVTKLSASVDAALLPGSMKARVRVRVTDGVNTTEAESKGTFSVPEKNRLWRFLDHSMGKYSLRIAVCSSSEPPMIRKTVCFPAQV